MVFSLFGRKGEASRKAEKEPPAARTPAAKPAANAAPPAAATGVAPNSLDFSSYVPAPKSQSPRPDVAPSLPAQGAPAATGLRAEAAAPPSSSSVLGDTGAKLPAAARSPALASRASASSAPVPSFKAKAADLARDFGFSSYSLREVTVNSNDQGMPRPRMMALPASAGLAESSVPIEAGKSAVVVTVSGSVQLR